MLSLLFKAPFKVSEYHLFKPYFVSHSVIKNDLKIMSNQLQKYELKIDNGDHRLSIIGAEINIRQAINEVLLRMNRFENTLDFTSNSFDLNMYDQKFILSQLGELKSYLGESIPFPYNINIFSHLYILVKRSREGKVLNNGNLHFDEKQRRLIQENIDLYNLAKRIKINIDRYLGTTLDGVESLFLLQYLVSARLSTKSISIKQMPNQVRAISHFYVEQVKAALGREINPIVASDLANHIKPMLNRLQNGIIVKNALLKEIREEYGQLFELICVVSKEVVNKFNLESPISPDENGFIALYFAKFLEMHSELKRIAIVCTTGIGTSQLLQVKIHKEFPEVEIACVTSTANYQEDINKVLPIDLVISTVNFKTSNNIPIVVVSALFTNADRMRVKRKLMDEGF
ncbi:BglG family transcription antiterminator [Sporolactobacillus shoreicorticis]|nr:PRD domain-containing protein [Sporolactobacillus shoreicorticis]